jgi:hypothetical protein
MSIQAYKQEPNDPWWFVPLLYAGVCLALATAAMGDLLFAASSQF